MERLISEVNEISHLRNFGVEFGGRHVHQAECAQRGVEAGIGQVQPLDIHAREAGVQHPSFMRSPTRRIDHSTGQVDADDLPALTDGMSLHERDLASAASDVEHLFAGLQRRAGQQLVLRGDELRLPQRLVVGCRQVPAVALDAPLQSRLHGVGALALRLLARIVGRVKVGDAPGSDAVQLDLGRLVHRVG